MVIAIRMNKDVLVAVLDYIKGRISRDVKQNVVKPRGNMVDLKSRPIDKEEQERQCGEQATSVGAASVLYDQ